MKLPQTVAKRLAVLWTTECATRVQPQRQLRAPRCRAAPTSSTPMKLPQTVARRLAVLWTTSVQHVFSRSCGGVRLGHVRRQVLLVCHTQRQLLRRRCPGQRWQQGDVHCRSPRTVRCLFRRGRLRGCHRQHQQRDSVVAARHGCEATCKADGHGRCHACSVEGAAASVTCDANNSDTYVDASDDCDACERETTHYSSACKLGRLLRDSWKANRCSCLTVRQTCSAVMRCRAITRHGKLSALLAERPLDRGAPRPKIFNRMTSPSPSQTPNATQESVTPADNEGNRATVPGEIECQRRVILPQIRGFTS